MLAALVFLSSCQTFRFYGQAIGGQLEIIRKSRPNKKVVADPATPPPCVGSLRRSRNPPLRQ